MEKQLLLLNPSKACGPDEVPPHLLKIVASEISPALSFLFQQSFNAGAIPQQWKQALVTPIFKSGERSDPSNYRPISLTCICSKIMEHILLSHISKHVASNSILFDNQHGFRQKLSTTTQLVSATHDWAHTLHLKGQTDVIFLDFQKAFDRVPHQLLQTKLDYYGIRGDTLRWIMALLSNRQQAVVVNGSQSSWKDVTSGVPQGSVIGPALFLLYVNDIHTNIKSTTRLFADDGIVYREIKTEMDHKTLQEDLDTLSQWSKTWLMGFNIGKCAVLTVTRKRKPSICTYHLVGECIPRVDQYKYLGVTISKDLRWNTHCQQIRNKASRTLGFLRRTLSPCTKEIKARAYQALVRPQLEYGAEVWNPHTTTSIEDLERIQKAAARFIYRDYRKSTSSSQLVSSLNLDPLHYRRLFAQSTMLFKIYHNIVDIPLPVSIKPAPFIGRRDHPFKLTIPDASVDAFKYSFYPRTVRIWNRLPYAAINTPSLTTFQAAAFPAIRSLQPPAGLRLL